MTAKLYIKTMGCQMNEYDSEKMADVLRASHGYELTGSPEDADLLLVNTCSIREKAQEKVFSELGRWRAWKEKRPEIMIGVGGCVASQEGEGIRKRAPFVDMVFGPQTLHRLPEMVNDVRSNGRGVVDISFPEIEKFDCLPEPRAEGPTAYVSVMEGCSKYCSFCVVPYTRGEEISRPLDDVIARLRAWLRRACAKLICWVKTSMLIADRCMMVRLLILRRSYTTLLQSMKSAEFVLQRPIQWNSRIA